MTAPTAIILPIGNELLSGRVIDTNTPYAAQRLTKRGVRVTRILTLPDDIGVIVEEIRLHATKADVLLTSGGIGATPDDLTRQAVAEAFGRPLVRNPEAVAQMGGTRPGYESEARWRMADLPEGCALIPNPITRAPGFIIENCYTLPGVPELFQVMFDAIEPLLPGSPIFFGELRTFRHEGEYAYVMDEALVKFPLVNIGSYPKLYGEDYACLLTFNAPTAGERDAAMAWFKEQLDALPTRAPR